MLWSVSSGELIRTFKGHGSDVTSVTFSPDGKIIASGSKDDTIKLWSVSSGELIRTFKGNTVQLSKKTAGNQDNRV